MISWINKNINILFWLYVSSILTLFVRVNYIYYVMILFLYFLFFIIYISNVKKENNFNLSYDRKLKGLFISFIIITVATTIISLMNNEFKNLAVYISVISIAFIPILFMKYFGDTYILNFYKALNRFGIILSLFGLVEFLLRQNIFYIFINNEELRTKLTYGFKTDIYRTYSIFFHPIVWGNFLICMLFVNLIVNKKASKVFKFITTILYLVNIYATKSRGAWISCIILSLIYYLLKPKVSSDLRKSYKKVIKNIVIALILLVFSKYIIILMQNIINRFFELTTAEGSVSILQRFGTVNLTLNEMKNFNIFHIFFGKGYKSLTKFLEQNTVILSNFFTSDNQYLNIIYEFGVSSLFIYILFLLIVNYKVFVKNMSDIFLISYFVFMAISINMFFYVAFGWKAISSLLFMSASLLIFENNKNTHS